MQRKQAKKSLQWRSETGEENPCRRWILSVYFALKFDIFILEFCEFSSDCHKRLIHSCCFAFLGEYLPSRKKLDEKKSIRRA